MYGICSKKSFFQENECEQRLMTINEISNGSNEFVGLLKIIQDYLSNIEVEADTRCTINQYLILISKRAAGTLMTNAAWMRQVVTNHPAYKHDSVVSDEIAYDLLWKMTKISTGEEHCPSVLPRMSSKTTLDISAAVEKENNELEVKRSLMNQHNNHQD